MEEVLLALVGPFVELIKLVSSDTYDPEAEKQVMLKMQRAAADVRAARLFKP